MEPRMPAVEYRKRNSILGSLALMLSLPALALNYFEFPGLPHVTIASFEMRFPTAIAAGVTALGVLSALLAGKSRRTGAELPLAATLIGAAALGLGYYRQRPAAAPPPPAPSPVVTPAPIKEPLRPPAAAPVPKPQVKPAAIPNASNVASQAKTLAETPTEAVRQQRGVAALRQAQSNLDKARAAVIHSLETDPIYLNTKAESDAADAELKRARAAYPPGDPRLVKISEAALLARDRLQIVIQDAVEKDASALEAQTQYQTAKSAITHPAVAKP